MRILPALLLAPLTLPLAFATPASADPICAGVEVVAVTSTGVTECVPYNNLVACRTETVAVSPVRVTVELCTPRK